MLIMNETLIWFYFTNISNDFLNFLNKKCVFPPNALQVMVKLIKKSFINSLIHYLNFFEFEKPIRMNTNYFYMDPQHSLKRYLAKRKVRTNCLIIVSVVEPVPFWPAPTTSRLPYWKKLIFLFLLFAFSIRSL